MSLASRRRITTLLGSVALVGLVSSFSNAGPSSTALGSKGAPAAPTGCTAFWTSFFGGAIAFVSWNDNSSNEDGFEIEWRVQESGQPSSGSLEVVADVTGTLVGQPVGAGTKGRFRVRAFNASGVSSWTQWASATFP